MLPRIKIGFTLLFAVLFLIIWGCEHSSDDIPTGVPYSVEYYIESGWNNFISGNFSGAYNDFEEATSRDVNSAEAFLGKGWSLLRSAQYTLAVSSINNALLLIEMGGVSDSDRIEAESYACLVGAYQGLYPGDVETYAPLVASSVDSALAIDPDFVFTYDSGVNYQTLIVAKADANFANSDFLGALEAITMLDPSFTIYNDPTVLDSVICDPIIAEILDSTAVTGFAKIIVPGAQLIKAISVKQVVTPSDTVTYQFPQKDSFVQGGEQIMFYGTPVPQEGDEFLVTYLNSPDYNQFLLKLRQLIDDIYEDIIGG